MDINRIIKGGLVSIIMPSYNNGQYINKSISSVLSQTYTNWELIIIDDASDDNTLSVVRYFTDKRIKVFSNSINKGVSRTRNIGIEAARGQYIAFLDSDDLWFPNKLSLQITALKENVNAVCSHGSYIRTDLNGKHLGYVKAESNVYLNTLYKGNFIGNLTGIIDRSKVGTILQKPVGHEDYLMWLDVLSLKNGSYSLAIIDVVAQYRVHAKSKSSNKFKSLVWHWEILRKQKKLTVCFSCYYILHYLVNAIKKRTAF
tara:strand:- start:20884 stop:21657 length:774 start_codon:yes stop_codon:yes gene_type:complete